MENTLFLGNGLNLLNGAKSWNDLLSSIAFALGGKNIIVNVPNTLQYESIMLDTYYTTGVQLVDTNGSMLTDKDGLRLYSTEKTESVLKQNIADALNCLGSSIYHKEFIALPFKHIITTNYDDSIAATLIENNYTISNRNFTERLYSIRRKVSYHNKNDSKTVYYIHGDMHHPNSIMLGLDHYCGSIAKIDAYLKGHYEFQKGVPLDNMPQRLKAGIKEAISWIDLFFMSNIHILGFGLDYSETDLWWILNKRKRYIRQYGESLVKNRIHMYGEIDDSKRKLLESLDVEVHLFHSKEGYPQMYEAIHKQLTQTFLSISRKPMEAIKKQKKSH